MGCETDELHPMGTRTFQGWTGSIDVNPALPISYLRMVVASVSDKGCMVPVLPAWRDVGDDFGEEIEDENLGL